MPFVLLVLGDLNFSGTGFLSELARQKYRPDFVFEAVRPTLKNADLVVANLEGPLTFADWSPDSEAKIWRFRQMPVFAETMHNAGIHVLLLANNHIADAGATGIEDTKRYLSAQGLQWVPPPGQGPYAFRKDRASIDLWNADLTTPAGSYPWAVSAAALVDAVSLHYAVQRSTSLVIVVLHDHADTEAQKRALAKQLFSAGVNWVAFGGNHAAGGVVRDGKNGMHLGIGNFVFGCDCTAETRGAALRLTIDGDTVSAANFAVDVGNASNGYVAHVQGETP